ncbi:hypothetical protein WMY93_000907 [Mugilogobius chulae]|uniref:Uncharacterized protein n=1 Tax=Mugilogobius chulae TaxID=88201 RepID=A0AAW0Q6G1_9GOBI
MAAGGTGAVTALLLYTLVINFRPPTLNSDFGHLITRQKQQYFYHKPLNKSLDYFYNHRHFPSHAGTNIGFGKHLLAVSLVFPSLYRQSNRKTNKSTSQQWTNTLIITICLILSGDIHPCPGPSPLHATPPEGTTDSTTSVERFTSFLEVCSLNDALRCDFDNTNLSYPSSSRVAVDATGVSQAVPGDGGRWCTRDSPVGTGVCGATSVERLVTIREVCPLDNVLHGHRDNTNASSPSPSLCDAADDAGESRANVVDVGVLRALGPLFGTTVCEARCGLRESLDHTVGTVDAGSKNLSGGPKSKHLLCGFTCTCTQSHECLPARCAADHKLSEIIYMQRHLQNGLNNAKGPQYNSHAAYNSDY